MNKTNSKINEAETKFNTKYKNEKPFSKICKTFQDRSILFFKTMPV